MDDYFALLTNDERDVFSAVAEYAFSLGYKAKKDKTKTLAYSFIHRKIDRRMLRFSIGKEKPVIKMKFFAMPGYSNFFHEAIRHTIEENDFKYTGCFGCGRCNGTQGYTYQYPDGKEYYRCGGELIEIFDILHIPLEEMLELFKTQHEFYLSGQTES